MSQPEVLVEDPGGGEAFDGTVTDFFDVYGEDWRTRKVPAPGSESPDANAEPAEVLRVDHYKEALCSVWLALVGEDDLEGYATMDMMTGRSDDESAAAGIRDSVLEWARQNGKPPVVPDILGDLERSLVAAKGRRSTGQGSTPPSSIFPGQRRKFKANAPHAGVITIGDPGFFWTRDGSGDNLGSETWWLEKFTEPYEPSEVSFNDPDLPEDIDVVIVNGRRFVREAES